MNTKRKKFTSDEVQGIIAQLNAVLADLKARWDQENVIQPVWWSIHRTNLVKITMFLLNCLDELVQFVETFIPDGTDKKTAVIMVISKLFDYVLVKAAPIWLKPFVWVLRYILIDIVANNLIDFLVAKYNQGSWRNNGGTEEAKTFRKM